MKVEVKVKVKVKIELKVKNEERSARVGIWVAQVADGGHGLDFLLSGFFLHYFFFV